MLRKSTNGLNGTLGVMGNTNELYVVPPLGNAKRKSNNELYITLGEYSVSRLLLILFQGGSGEGNPMSFT